MGRGALSIQRRSGAGDRGLVCVQGYDSTVLVLTAQLCIV